MTASHFSTHVLCAPISNSNILKPRIYSLGNTHLPQVCSCSDLGVIIDDKPTFSNHILSTTEKAYTYMYACPILEYASLVWSSHFTKYIDALERVHRRFTKSFHNLRSFPYSSRIGLIDLQPLHIRRLLLLILPLVTASFMNSLISILHSSSHFTHILTLAVIHSLSLNLRFDSTITNFFSLAIVILGISCPSPFSHLDHSQHLNSN